jgi:hypothetical protein
MLSTTDIISREQKQIFLELLDVPESLGCVGGFVRLALGSFADPGLNLLESVVRGKNSRFPE